MAWALSVWSDVECNSGTRKAEVWPLASGGMTLAVSGDEALTFAAPRMGDDGADHYWVDQIEVLDVIRAENRTTNETIEWRVRELTDVRAESGAIAVQVKCDPILLDLRRAIVALVVDGGPTIRNLGGIGMSIAQYIDTYVLTAATAAGMTWWERGDVSNADGVDLSWDGYTALELLRDLAHEKGLELRAVRNGSTSYEINVETITTTDAAVDLDVDRNVRSLTRRRVTDNWANLLIPRGKVPDGAVDFGDIGDNRWEIQAKGTDGGGDWLTIHDPQSLLSLAVRFDDQLNGLYLESEDETTREEITDSVYTNSINIANPYGPITDSKLYLADTSDFAVGDRVRIVADSSGTFLTELPHPESVATYGEVRGYYSRPDARTEANLLKGTSFTEPRWSDHTDPLVYVATADGTQNSTTLNLKNLPEGLVISVGDLVGDTNSTYDSTVTSGDTVGVDGLATISVTPTISVANNDVFPLVVGVVPASGSSWPHDYYTDSNAETQGVFIRELSEYNGVYASAQYDGNYSGSATVDVKGLTPNTRYEAPAWFSGDGTTSSGEWLIGGFTTNGSGEATIYLSSGTTPKSDGLSCGLMWPDLSGAPYTSRFVAVTNAGYISAQRWDLEPFGVRYIASKSTLYVAFGLSHWGTGRSWNETGTSTYRTPSLDIGVRALGSATGYTVTTSTVPDYTTTTNTVFHVDHTASVTLSQDSEVFIELNLPRYVAVNAALNTVIPADDPVFVRYICAWLGPSTEPPLVEGSYANQLWHLANEHLATNAYPPVTYSLTLADLTEITGFDPDTEKLELGAEVVVRDRDLGIETTVRIVAIDYDLTNPMASRITLDRRPTRASTLLLPSRWSSTRVEGATRSVEGLDVRPAVREDGAYRAIPTGGANANGGEVTSSIYES